MNRDKALKLFEPFENVLFDFGGIFLDLDFQKTILAFSKLGSAIPFDQLFTKYEQKPIFNLLETGKINPDFFIQELKTMLNLHQVSDQQIIDAWCAMLLEVKLERIDFLKELKKTKKIYMLSNINQIHEDYLIRYFAKNSSLKDFYSHFDRVYFSHHIGLRKPDLAVFEYVCNHSKLDPKHTIFIDDSLGHIENARQYGLATFYLNPSNTFIV